MNPSLASAIAGRQNSPLQQSDWLDGEQNAVAEKWMPRAAGLDRFHIMNIKITYYLEVVSSWCYWAEPAWAELKQRYAKAPVDFHWAIALLDESSMSKSRAQADWFYRRSGTIVRSPFMLNSGWWT